MISHRLKFIIALMISAILGAVAFFTIYPYLLDFSYDAWLLTAGPDQIQYYTGWLLYRQADWSWPVGLMNNYAYPSSIAISYTDSIPLLAILFKIFRDFLPSVFQYTGLWLLLCFILQGIFAYLLLEFFLHKKILSLLGSIFFILSPIMLFRMGGHFALSAHWLILAAWFLFFSQSFLAWKSWLFLLAIAILVHPYLFLMVLFIALAKVFDLFLIKKTLNYKIFLAYIFGISGLSIFLAYALGLFQIEQSTAAGYGDFSLNLNALINPLTWSGILGDRQIMLYQAEGFSYLGFGVILLLFFAVFIWLTAKNKRQFLKNNLFLLLFCLFLTLLALSHIWTWDDQILFKIAWPSYIIDNVLGIFRSSGRLFWPVYYLLLLAAILSVKKIHIYKSIIILSLALGVQIYDLSAKVTARGVEYSNKIYTRPVQTQIEALLPNYQHLVFLPVINHRYFPYFVELAAQNKLTVNDGYFAREPSNLLSNKNMAIERLKNGHLDQDTVYIISRDLEILSAKVDREKNLVINFDNNLLIFPGAK